MTNETCLVLIKPDGILKSITGNIITELSAARLKIIGAKMVSVSQELAEKHYNQLKKEHGEEIFQQVLKYIKGEYHTNRVLALVYYGEDACAKIRAIAGSTNPENADPTTIRGRYGRIHSKIGIENCVHASDCPKNGEREVKLWFLPTELTEVIYKTKSNKKEIELLEWQ